VASEGNHVWLPPQLDEVEATKHLMAGLKVRYDDLSEAEYVANIAKILLNGDILSRLHVLEWRPG
jgi:hypothetical protein